VRIAGGTDDWVLSLIHFLLAAVVMAPLPIGIYGTALTLNYKGTLAHGKIAGEVTVDPFGVTGDFTALMQK
jgi:hypothetical protein